jgi:hypothetical protein
MAIVMGRDKSRAFMWSAMTLKENASVQFLFIYVTPRESKVKKSKKESKAITVTSLGGL